MSVDVASARWGERRRRVLQSVFQTDISQPTPQSTPAIGTSRQGQAFGVPPSPFHALRHGAATSFGGPHSPSAPQREPRRGQGPRPRPPESPVSETVQQSTSRASQVTVGDDQVAYDLAWHVVTSRIVLPASASADDSFGTLAPTSQFASQSESSEVEFYEALDVIFNAKTVVPRATHTEDIAAWHTQQTRTHFAQHVVPLLSACVHIEGQDEAEDAQRTQAWPDNYYERHIVAVMTSIRTIQAAQRMYDYGLELLNRGFARSAGTKDPKRIEADAMLLRARFARDLHALVANSASASLMYSIRVVLVRLVGTILGIPLDLGKDQGMPQQDSPRPPTAENLHAVAARERLQQLTGELYGVGLGGEKFRIVFAEVMHAMMSRFVQGAFAGVWTAAEPSRVPRRTDNISRSTRKAASSSCIEVLTDWVENHFARLAFEILTQTSPPNSEHGPSPVSLSDAKTYQTFALGELASLRIAELFDIVLAWPESKGALDDLRATITNPARRVQLTDSFTAAVHTRLLHPGRSTLEILRTYVAIIRTFYALDHSKVLLSRVVPSLDLYLCHRDDAVRTVVSGLLAGPEEVLAARTADEQKKRAREEMEGGDANEAYGSGKMDLDDETFMTPPIPRAVGDARGKEHETPRSGAAEDSSATQPPITASASGSGHLVELAMLLVDPRQVRRNAIDDEDLDWDDLTWVPDPVDAGASYKRPKSEDVIGTLISALGSQDTFIKEFSAVVAERLLGEPARFDQELRVLDLLKRRFGEQALQNCDVMIKDIQDSRKVDTAIVKAQQRRGLAAPHPGNANAEKEEEESAGTQFHSRILSRLFWPNLDREHFLLPGPVIASQAGYERGYEAMKANRKLTWLNQLGQARVELELSDRVVAVDCKTYEATVIYAFQDQADGDADLGADARPNEPKEPVKRAADELYMQLQMDEDLIAAALEFWVAQGVLRRLPNEQDVYAVVETLPTAAELAAEAARKRQAENDEEGEEEPAAVTRSTKPSIDPKELERRAMYWQYIKGMLTNASATMPLAQMGMMLKMLIADFPWSNEELLEFLGEKVAEGDLEIVGAKYKLIKK